MCQTRVSTMCSVYVHSALVGLLLTVDEVAEWLRRWTANPMGSARVGSNPILVGKFCRQLGIGPLKQLSLPGIEPGPPGRDHNRFSIKS